MNMLSIIETKKLGKALSPDQIRWFVDGYTKGDIPDYQAAALLMAICLKGMNKEETFGLTEAMRASGDVMDLSGIQGIKVDKHSTGGVGDKTTFVVGSLAAAWGVPVAKLSGRGLGFTGGTIDKMESIPGMKSSLEPKEFQDQVNAMGFAVMGQTGQVAPADKKLYALRDVTNTVDNISLIAGSIMSKKLASGSDAIVLDVKCGKGAFMKDQASAEKLAEVMREIGLQAGKKVSALVTAMDQPLGTAVGNGLEMIEVIETLKCRGPEDLTELSLELAAHMIHLGGKAKSLEEGFHKAAMALKDGMGLEKLRDLILAQGGDPAVLEDYSLFPQASVRLEWTAPSSGYITELDARKIGEISRITGAGRLTKEDPLDLGAGVLCQKKIGDFVEAGETVLTILSSHMEKAQAALALAADACIIGSEKPEPSPLVIKVFA
ncbi:MAG: thymidine phosphorylase [Clostridiales bacterium]|nr:thymidine phosphorylase [Clostridiales bacterium]